ncbi:MAG: TIM barrel protein, partial [Usitatibacteraceae bacterium]
MPRFAANISFMFTEIPFLDRFRAAAEAGFCGVEFHYPYGYEPQEIRALLDTYRLAPVLINIRAGQVTLGDWGFAGVPGREESFRMCVAEAIEYANAIGVPQLNCLAGVLLAGADRAECEATLVANLRFAARECLAANLAVNLEPINSHDVPGYLINTPAEAIRLMDTVGAPNLKLQYDCYHVEMMERGGAGVIAAGIDRLASRIGHIQFADAPGRHEPGTGTIDFREVFECIDALS